MRKEALLGYYCGVEEYTSLEEAVRCSSRSTRMLTQVVRKKSDSIKTEKDGKSFI